MQYVNTNTSQDTQLLFLPSLFNETLSALFDANHYFQSHGTTHQAMLAPDLHTLYAEEVTRITMRLTSAMAWLMMHRAAHEEGNTSAYALDGTHLRLQHPSALHADLPEYLHHLSQRSGDIYQRVHRIDSRVLPELAFAKKRAKKSSAEPQCRLTT